MQFRIHLQNHGKNLSGQFNTLHYLDAGIFEASIGAAVMDLRYKIAINELLHGYMRFVR